jgi:hypothetical protein
MSVIYGPLLKDERVKHHPLVRAFAEDWASDLGDQVCTVCGAQMTYPAIQWMAANDFLYFHPACVVHWMLRLMRDVHESECTTGRYVTRHAFDATDAQEWERHR